MWTEWFDTSRFITSLLMYCIPLQLHQPLWYTWSLQDLLQFCTQFGDCRNECSRGVGLQVSIQVSSLWTTECLCNWWIWVYPQVWRWWCQEIWWVLLHTICYSIIISITEETARGEMRIAPKVICDDMIWWYTFDLFTKVLYTTWHDERNIKNTRKKPPNILEHSDTGTPHNKHILQAHKYWKNASKHIFLHDLEQTWIPPGLCRNRTTQQRRLRVSMEHTHMWVGSLVL